MNRVCHIILSPNIVEAIKKVKEGKGVQLVDLDWQSQSVETRDTTETCYTFTNFKQGQEVTFTQPEIKSVDEQSETQAD